MQTESAVAQKQMLFPLMDPKPRFSEQPRKKNTQKYKKNGENPILVWQYHSFDQSDIFTACRQEMDQGTNFALCWLSSSLSSSTAPFAAFFLRVAPVLADLGPPADPLPTPAASAKSQIWF